MWYCCHRKRRRPAEMSWGLTALPSGPHSRMMVSGCVSVDVMVYSWKCPVGGASLWGLMGIGEMIKFSGQALRAGAEVGMARCGPLWLPTYGVSADGWRIVLGRGAGAQCLAHVGWPVVGGSVG